MRKLCSLLTAVLFAGSMMAIDFTLSSAESVTKDGVTVTFDKGSGTNAPAWYTAGLRLYASNTVTISSESNITAISFNWEKQGSKAFNTVTASTGSYTHPTEAGVGAWTGSATSITFTLGASGQLQLKTFSVTVGEGGGVQPVDTTSTDTVPVVPPVVGDTLTCAAAAELALAGNTDEHVIKGYVTEIATPWSSQYSNISFWMADTKDGGKVFQGYRIACATEAEAPVVGDLVWIKGNLKKYNDIAETNAGGTFGILARAEIQPVDTTSTDTVPVVPPVVGDTLTCSAAAELALAGNTDEHVIKGYVTEIATPWSSQYSNISFWMADAVDGGKVFQGYRIACATEAEAPVVGDLVWIKGNLKKYNDIAETNAGGTFGILARAEIQPVDTTSTDTVPVVPPVVGDTLTCAAAAELALAGNTDEHVIKGYVTEIATPWSSQYSNISFWMADTKDGGKVFQGYRIACATEAEAPVVGDLVWIKGNLKKYNDIAETNAGGTFGILAKSTVPVVEPVNLGEKTIAEFLELKNTKDTCILTGIIANVANTQYGNFDLAEGTDTLYIYGLKDATGANCFESEGLEEGDTLTIKAVYTTYNNAPQAKNAIFVEVKKAGSVTPGAEVEITIADGSFNDYVEYYGYWLVEAQNDDYYISLSNDNMQITQAAGTYTAADLYAKDSYILTETDSISFVSGSIVLDVDAEGVATVTGSLVGNDGKTYILNIVCPAPGEHEYDEDSDFIRNFSSYTIDTEYLSEYGDINVEASDEAGYQIVLDLYVPTGASGLVAGTYEINSTYEAGTVAAGVFYDGGIYPSYAGIATTEGLTNVWYLVSGTVVVDANLNITVNAVNSLGHSVKATLSADSGTGIEETLAAGKAAKVVRDGQVRILKAEKTFDVTGARIR